MLWSCIVSMKGVGVLRGTEALRRFRIPDRSRGICPYSRTTEPTYLTHSRRSWAVYSCAFFRTNIHIQQRRTSGRRRRRQKRCRLRIHPRKLGIGALRSRSTRLTENRHSPGRRLVSFSLLVCPPSHCFQHLSVLLSHHLQLHPVTLAEPPSTSSAHRRPFERSATSQRSIHTPPVKICPGVRGSHPHTDG